MLKIIRNNRLCNELAKCGVDYNTGINITGGILENYILILESYIEENQDKILKIEENNSKDFKSYQILFHSLKSSSKAIGADLIAEEAEKLESAAREKDMQYLEENMNLFLSKMWDLIHGLMQILNLKS